MKKTFFVILSFLIVIISSSSCYSPSKAPYEDFYYFENYSGDLYFPEVIGITDFENGWYSHQLLALEEPIIYAQKDSYKTIYRFTCLRTFHNPFSIRIEIDEHEASAMLFFKMSSGAGGYDPGELMISEQKKLESEEFKSLVNVMGKYNYWELPFEDGSLGLDGSEWIIELLEDNKYHAISRWTPSNCEVYDLGNIFIELSGQNIEELY